MARVKIPCAGLTRTGLRPGQWALRLIGLLAAQGVTSGCLFSKKPARQTYLSDYEDKFYALTEEV